MSDNEFSVPTLPPSAPAVKNPIRFFRWLARRILRVTGWKVRGPLPDVSRLVMIIAPHSSNWDGFWGMVTKIAIGFEVNLLAKAQLFWWPLGPLLRRLGARPLDRRSPQGTVEQAIDLIDRSDRLWYALTPEGTRSAVKAWKTGFWKIAHGAKVPILMAYFHYPEKIMNISDLFWTTDDMDADMARIREFYRPWMGKNRGTA
ncbi:MAG: lysophospholipid acyltransferase family protein [Xanthomonadaceae bacterium]|jgi:1-acyl-sn-glycerol-3-phosphate acyltransferase|nr:lysophospholipid acyltransferase family protein [Xanthomonadaceae bacterium]